MKILKYNMLILGLVFLTLISGCGKNGNVSISDLIKKSKDIKNISYQIVAEYNNPEYAKSEGKIWAKNGKMRQDLDLSGVKMQILIDSSKKEILSYVPDQKSATRSAISESEIIQNDPFGVIYGIKENDIKSFKNSGIENINGRNCYLFNGKITGIKGEQYKKQGIKSLNYKIYIDISTGVLSKLEMKAKNKVVTKIVVKSVKLNKVEDKNLKLVIPKGVTIKKL